MLANNPSIEALQLITVARRSGESIEAVRKQIGTHSDYRKQVLIAFDLLNARWRRIPLTLELRAEIVRLLKLGYGQREVAKKLGIGRNRVVRLALRLHASSWRLGLTGHRLSRAQRQELRQDIFAGVHPNELRKKYGICTDTLNILRRKWHDPHDWRRVRALTDAQAAEVRAALEAHAETYWALAKRFGVGMTTIGNVHRRENGY
jgi:transposase